MKISWITFGMLVVGLALSPRVEGEPLCSEAFESQIRAIRKSAVAGQVKQARENLAAARKMPEVASCSLASVALDLREVEIFLKEGDLSSADQVVSRLQKMELESPRLSADLLHNAGMIAYNLGQFARARESYKSLEEQDRELGDLFNVAADIYNIATTYLAEPADDQVRERAVAELARALEAARQAKHRDIEAQVHLELGKLADGPEAVRHLETCRELARIPIDVTGCLGALAVARAEADSPQARELLAQAMEIAEQAAEEGNPWPLIFRWSDRMLVNWQTQPRDRAIVESLAALRHIETLRREQGDLIAKAGLFSVWADAYHWLAGRLLRLDEGEPSQKDIHLAFLIKERYRARALIDSLERAGVVLETEAPEADESGAETNPEAMASTLPAFPGLADRQFASLADIETHLAPDEALLSFQVAPWADIYGRFGGGSWLIATTRSGSRAYRLPDRHQISHKVKAHLGLMSRQDGSESTMAVALYAELVGAALEELPKGIDKLLVIPDGDLHLLPFGTLRASSASAPLAVTHQISIVPSATLWLRWTRGSREAPSTSALILADPQLPDVAEPPGSTTTRDQPSRLLHALAEGEKVKTYMGPSITLLSGASATEGVLKQQLQSADHEFGLVHFAAHAVVDGIQPERSAVLLAADRGSGASSDLEDGNLQIHEIVELSLDGRMVVLSACSSASGSVFKGEGVMSLARAFFHAGANTVIGTLQPVGDREALELFDELYRHLTRGSSVREALHLAQKAMIEAGRPAAAWAGVVVIGDGARILVTSPHRVWPVAWGLALFLMVAYAVLVARRRRG
ncbi:MAG: CHAT domain-containing protein [Acidobacteriota bacterium]